MGLLVNNVQLVLNVVGCKRRGRLTVGITMSTVVDVQMQVKRDHLRANVDAEACSKRQPRLSAAGCDIDLRDRY